MGNPHQNRKSDPEQDQKVDDPQHKPKEQFY